MNEHRIGVPLVITIAIGGRHEAERNEDDMSCKTYSEWAAEWAARSDMAPIEPSVMTRSGPTNTWDLVRDVWFEGQRAMQRAAVVAPCVEPVPDAATQPEPNITNPPQPSTVGSEAVRRGPEHAASVIDDLAAKLDAAIDLSPRVRWDRTSRYVRRKEASNAARMARLLAGLAAARQELLAIAAEDIDDQTRAKFEAMDRLVYSVTELVGSVANGGSKALPEARAVELARESLSVFA